MVKKTTLKKKNIVQRKKKSYYKKLKKNNIVERKRKSYQKELKKKLNEELGKLGVNKSVDSINFVKNGFMYLIIFYVFYILFISGIIYYINRIKDCKCFQEKNKLVGVNITYIYIIEIILLVLAIITILQLFLGIKYLNEIKSGGGTVNNIGNKISYLISLFINGYLIYNIIKLSEIPTDDCECDKSSLKNLLYIQSGIIIVTIIFSGIIIFRQ
jgi:hypothetical protein